MEQHFLEFPKKQTTLRKCLKITISFWDMTVYSCRLYELLHTI